MSWPLMVYVPPMSAKRKRTVPPLPKRDNVCSNLSVVGFFVLWDFITLGGGIGFSGDFVSFFEKNCGRSGSGVWFGTDVWRFSW